MFCRFFWYNFLVESDDGDNYLDFNTTSSFRYIFDHFVSKDFDDGYD